MGRGPTNENTNMYFQARKKAATYNERLWSREGAAELLGISVSTLADYELGNTKVVPVDKVVLMADLYNAPELITGYCMRECPVHGFLPLATEEKSLEGMISQDAVKKKFTEVLGQKAPQFLASITNVVAGSAQLKKCPATTIMSAAFVAATYDLPIDSNLGFAAIVPYNNNKYNQQTRQWEKHPEAQFQMMYKGFIQLAIRSGYYEKMNCSVVYKDELVSYNPITGEVEFVTDFSKCTQRAEGKSENIAGYYAWFKLLTGFRKELFMTTAEVENHARKYSTAYRYDLENNKKGSKWTTDFEAMALKTVIKMLLSKWGILSVDMQRAIQDDQKVYDEDGDGSYGDNQPDIVEAQDPFDKIEQKEEEQQIGGLDLEEVE